ncbi:hypothetical protein AKJ09_03930 [Labilithrix luteola]|uniref:EF-hand domain-containing protein n=1 Tax=Labilithrix luteola TaxID=1391654 RepID=A0A0K1PV76_9BACT|nr:hypothetical protein [Labilithrix luteola]AKU97266.1 hypothetical protein AKJ09_03930 [Labilithrix luteola]
MKRALALAFALLGACVPASEKPPPAGAAGFASDPSPPTRGEPFMTDDGWTITFTRVAIMANISAISANPKYSGGAERWEWNAAMHAEPFARAIGIGPAAISVTLQGLGLPVAKHDNVSRVNVDDAIDARFRVTADDENSFWPDDRYHDGPALIVSARAEKGDRKLAIDLGLLGTGANSLPFDRTHTLVVREDDLTLLPLLVAAENLFLAGADPYAGRFDLIADADSNGDGQLTPDELRAVPIDCETCATLGSPPTNMLMLISSRTPRVLVAQ